MLIPRVAAWHMTSWNVGGEGSGSRGAWAAKQKAEARRRRPREDQPRLLVGVRGATSAKRFSQRPRQSALQHTAPTCERAQHRYGRKPRLWGRASFGSAWLLRAPRAAGMRGDGKQPAAQACSGHFAPGGPCLLFSTAKNPRGAPFPRPPPDRDGCNVFPAARRGGGLRERPPRGGIAASQGAGPRLVDSVLRPGNARRFFVMVL